MRTIRLAALAGLLFLPVPSSAQSVELFAITGVVQLWDDEGNLGVGVPIGGGVGIKLPHGWGIEALAETQKVRRSFDSDVQFDSTVTAARARVIKYFGEGPAQWYTGGSLGATRVESTRNYPSGCQLVNHVFTCTSRDIFESTSKAGTFSGFAGMRIAAGSRMFVRPEFELSVAGEHMRLGATVAVGASW